MVRSLCVLPTVYCVLVCQRSLWPQRPQKLRSARTMEWQLAHSTSVMAGVTSSTAGSDGPAPRAGGGVPGGSGAAGSGEMAAAYELAVCARARVACS